MESSGAQTPYYSLHLLRADNCKQSKVGEGETLGLVMLGSDKTHLNNTYGDKHIHGVYMTCGNIDKDIRTKLSARVWVMIAQIPVVKFLEKSHQGILTQRLLHVCMDFVTAKLKECSKNPEYMSDAAGILRLIRTILLAHIADFPEQQAIACVSGDASPISVARHNELGLTTCQALRTADYTLSKIKELLDSGVNPSNLSCYKTEARKAGLNGVHRPYWRDWTFAEPSTFLTPNALHQWHIFFAKHPMMWARKLIGDAEIDQRYKSLQKHVGHRHFPNGFTTFSQHTGREHQDLEASFIAVLSGHPRVTPGVMTALRALLDFIYLSQYESVTSITLRRIEEAHRRFHDNRHHLVAAGIRATPNLMAFNIKKLELMHHVPRFITEVGSLQQFSADQTERCHVIMAKIPYKSTNRKAFRRQMCRFSDRQDKIDLFRLYLSWKRRSMVKRSPRSGQAGSSSCPLSNRPWAPTKSLFRSSLTNLNRSRGASCHKLPATHLKMTRTIRHGIARQCLRSQVESVMEMQKFHMCRVCIQFRTYIPR